jgi:hypothetical protein
MASFNIKVSTLIKIEKIEIKIGNGSIKEIAITLFYTGA